MGDSGEGELNFKKAVGQGIILVLFGYFIINLSQFFAWFGWFANDQLSAELCPVNLSSYLFYESISSVLYFILSSGITSTSMIMGRGLNNKMAIFFTVLAIISGVLRVLWNSIACYWIDTYPLNCRHSLHYKMSLASVILFFVMNVPVVMVHGRLIVEKLVSLLNDHLNGNTHHAKGDGSSGINLQLLANNPKYSDVEFLVEDTLFYGHRVVLAARCEYFSKLLYGGMKESAQTSPIHLQDVSADSFLQILEFIYSGSITGLDIKDLVSVIELMRCADLLSFNLLKDYLEMWLKPRIDANNIIAILLHSYKYNYNTKSFAMKQLLKLKSKLRKTEEVLLQEEPGLYNSVVEVFIENK